jgi:hypothetical protein
MQLEYVKKICPSWCVPAAFLTTDGGFVMGLVWNSVLSDTCLSLQEYLQDPANTTLDSVLPCATLAADNQTYLTTRQGMDELIRNVHPLNLQPFSY